MQIWDIFIFSLLMCRESPTLPSNRAIILIRPVVENPLVAEDAQYFLGKNAPATEFPHHRAGPVEGRLLAPPSRGDHDDRAVCLPVLLRNTIITLPLSSYQPSINHQPFSPKNLSTFENFILQ